MFLKRIKNLWDLSHYEPSNPQRENNPKVGDSFIVLQKSEDTSHKPQKMAQIIKRKDNVEEAINEVLG